MAVRRDGHPWPFIDRSCGRSWLFVSSGGAPLLLVVMGPCGRSWVLVVGPWTLVGARRCPSIIVVGPRGHSLMEGVGPRNRSYALADRHSGGSLWPIVRGRGGPSWPCVDGGAGQPWTLVGGRHHSSMVVVASVVGVVRRERW